MKHRAPLHLFSDRLSISPSTSRTFFQWGAAGAMGCTPSKSAVNYSQDRIYRDLDTCSTLVPSLKSSVSTPEKPRLCVETSDGKQTYLSVPGRDVHGRSVRLSPSPDLWSSAGSVAPGSPTCSDQFSMTTRGPTPDLHSDTEGCGTA